MRRVAAVFDEMVRAHSRALGVSRRDFLASGPGLAAALLAMNRVFGSFFDVEPVEAYERAAFEERSPQQQFVLDMQTHHVARSRDVPPAALEPDPRYFLSYRWKARRWNSAIDRRPEMSDLYLPNYIREMFIDSDTSVAALTGIPSAIERTNILPSEAMAQSREIVNRLAKSRRLLTHAVVAPNRGAESLDDMRRQAAGLRPDAWSAYTGLPFGDPPRAWRLDDESVAYPMLEEAKKLGVKIVCVHKGLPLTGTNEDDWHPRDLAKAARDFPDINFVVYHAGFRSLASAFPVIQDDFRTLSRIDWISDLCEIRQRDPTLRNIYAELGSTFALTVFTSPMLCAHVLGMLLGHLDEDHVLWGTDSIWWGSPRWQLTAFRRFKMKAALHERFGWAALTPAVKDKILGVNAAKLYGIDPTASVNPIPRDFVSRMNG
jgi:uncharacterized protein